MRQRAVIAGFTVLLAAGAYGVFGPSSRCEDRPLGQATGHPADPPGSSTHAAVASNVERGRPIGAFDPAMSGVCRFSCAASQPFVASDVAFQPGVANGALTQCPVSGVVFAVDEGRRASTSRPATTCCAAKAARNASRRSRAG